MLRVFCSICSLFLFCSAAAAADYSLTLYGGRYTDDKLGHVLLSKPIRFEDSNLGVVALAKSFALASAHHQWELEGQVGRHYRGQDHWEFNFLAIYRWQSFPWNKYLVTTAAIGDGLSYATEVPPLELSSPSNEGADKLMNYILVEFTFAPPQARNWSLVTRVHHRSGVYGLFGDTRGGSNVIAAGLKFRL